jgi:hypothetical protein
MKKTTKKQQLDPLAPAKLVRDVLQELRRCTDELYSICPSDREEKTYINGKIEGVSLAMDKVQEEWKLMVGIHKAKGPGVKKCEPPVLKLYLLDATVIDQSGTNVMLVRATSPAQARELAAENHGRQWWKDKSECTCKEVKLSGKAEVIGGWT